MSKDPPDIRRRSYGYSLRAIKLYQTLQQGKDGAGWVLGKQYLRAATSIGANVEEAQSAESRPDFVHKYGIAQKEARESLYWLRLLAESGIVPSQRLRPLMKETEELFAVITGIILSTKSRSLKCKG
ncbi:MAG: four helix bundle protein [Terriglobia bacterium]|jgi:four helix bundle protein